MTSAFSSATLMGVLALGGSLAAAGLRQLPPPAQSLAVSGPGTDAPKSILDGAYTAEQAKRGETVYTETCASCHGAALEGGGEAPPLTGTSFTSDWDGQSVGDIFERVRVSMPASSPGRLSRQQDADVVAYILSIAKLPTGKTDLPTDLELLRQIRFEKPVKH